MNRQAWRDAYGEPTAAFDRRLDQTLSNLHKERKMKKISIRAVIIAAVITVLSIGAVYAAVTGRFSVADYYAQVYDTHIPESFSSGYDQTIDITAGNVTMHVRDAYVDGPAVYLLAELKTKDGTPGYFTMADVGPDDQIGQFYLDKEKQKDARTFREAAKEAGGGLYEAAVSLRTVADGVEDYGDESLDFWYEEGDACVLQFSKQLMRIPEDAVELPLTLIVVHEDGAREETSMTISLPVKEKSTRTILIDKPVEGLPVTLDTLTVTSGRMSNFYSIAWHYDASVTDEQAAQTDIWFELLDDSLNRLPDGAVTGCGINDKGEKYYVQEYESTPADLALDHLILRAYAPMEDGKPRYGSVAVSLQ